MPDTKDKDALLHLYNSVLPPLAERIYQNLQEVIPLFDDFKLEKVLNTWTKDRQNASDKPLSLENGNLTQMGLRLQLLGFHRAGPQAFDLVKDLLLQLEHTYYTVGPDRETTWLEKKYFESWTKPELEDVAQRWSEEVVEELTKQLEGLG